MPQEREAGRDLQAADRRDEAAAGVRSVHSAHDDERVPNEGGRRGTPRRVLQDPAGEERDYFCDGIHGLPRYGQGKPQGWHCDGGSSVTVFGLFVGNERWKRCRNGESEECWEGMVRLLRLHGY